MSKLLPEVQKMSNAQRGLLGLFEADHWLGTFPLRTNGRTLNALEDRGLIEYREDGDGCLEYRMEAGVGCEVDCGTTPERRS